MSAVTAIAATPLLAVIAVEDLRHHRIRNRHVLALAALAAGSVAIAAAGGDRAMAGHAAVGALLGAAPLAAVWALQPGRIGGGDVKLAATLGALVGAINPWMAAAVIGMALAGSLVAALVLRTQRVALAPGMSVAAVLVTASSVVA
jgi:leader peptidase (prepilin peptidase) / N-methyltransferase